MHARGAHAPCPPLSVPNGQCHRAPCPAVPLGSATGHGMVPQGWMCSVPRRRPCPPEPHARVRPSLTPVWPRRERESERATAPTPVRHGPGGSVSRAAPLEVSSQHQPRPGVRPTRRSAQRKSTRWIALYTRGSTCGRSGVAQRGHRYRHPGQREDLCVDAQWQQRFLQGWQRSAVSSRSTSESRQRPFRVFRHDWRFRTTIFRHNMPLKVFYGDGE